MFAIVAVLSSFVADAQQNTQELTAAKAEIARIEKLVEAGAVPPSRLQQAREALAEAGNQDVLRRTLYGSLRMEDLTEELANQMLASAHKLVAGQQSRLEHARALVDQGVAARTSLEPLQEELDNRRKTLAVAEERVKLWGDLTAMARAEQARFASLEAERAAALQSEDAAGAGIFSPSKARQLEADFEKVFHRDLPVTARGDTAFHRALGFDHTGRMDVGVNPSSAEGQWLSNWLDHGGIHYIAFSTAVRGQASAPHIHIGPPSSRLRTVAAGDKSQN